MTGNVPGSYRSRFDKTTAALFNLVFPDDCRLCGAPLANASRIPVCPHCLSEPQPLVAEYFCACCRTPFLNDSPLDENGLCELCRRGLLSFDAAYSYGAYEGTLCKLIHLLKYGRIKPLAGPLGRLIASAVPQDQSYDYIAPVPLHWWRRMQRGFNQAELLAEAVARRYGKKPVNILRRGRSTSAQAGLELAERRANVSGAFLVRRGIDVAGKKVLLIDDVLTTGATLAACSAAIKRAGARSVAVLTLARVDRRSLVQPSASRPIAVEVPEWRE